MGFGVNWKTVIYRSYFLSLCLINLDAFNTVASRFLLVLIWPSYSCIPGPGMQWQKSLCLKYEQSSTHPILNIPQVNSSCARISSAASLLSLSDLAASFRYFSNPAFTWGLIQHCEGNETLPIGFHGSDDSVMAVKNRCRFVPIWTRAGFNSQTLPLSEWCNGASTDRTAEWSLIAEARRTCCKLRRDFKGTHSWPQHLLKLISVEAGWSQFWFHF